MAKELLVFENPAFGLVRSYKGESDEVFFCAIDVCRALGYGNSREALRKHVEDDDVTKRDTIDNMGRKQFTSFINESGLYALVFASKLPKAREFKHWVTAEVLPQIRRTGGYIPVKEEDDEKTILCKALMIYKRTVEEKEALLEQQRPKVEYCDDVLMSEDCVTTTQVAKQFGLSAIALNNKLHELKIQFKQSGQWHLYARFAKMGLTKERTSPYYDSEGCIHTSVLTVWTERGKRFISELIRSGYDLDLALVKIRK